ncbi:MAG: glycosyltransferase family 4 protein [Actinomycetia bacterium]|nr:glycosyltransferase family 4 protein [Actinomycetes bacterium]MCP4222990.1 glycosyltransferase family 4 protein [Actinomycetes bacterium]MCP5031902.1 glycosyltransferase family 4 protein [Actinomycetes bacterium]
MSQLHIAHLSSVHPPFDIRIFHKECRSLASAGYRVSLVVTHSHDEMRDGVQLVAVPLASSRWKRMLVTPVHILRKALPLNADVYQFHDPELIPVGLLLRLLGRRVVYDVHEDVPLDLLHKTYLPSWVAKSLSLVAKLVHKVADLSLSGIVVVTPGVAEPFRDPVMVRNFPLLEEFTELGPPLDQRPEAAVYVGVMGPTRGTRDMTEVATILAASGERTIELAGSIRDDPELQAKLAADGESGPMRYHGVLDRDGVRSLLDGARVGLYLSPPEILAAVASYPIKVFEYMAAGLPVVVSDFPTLREIIGGAECGLLVDPRDPAAVAEAIIWMIEHPLEAEEMGRRGRKAVFEHYNFAGEAENLDHFYRQLCASDPAPHHP